ncbi:hypothetical protein P691DRAFT_801602 [Macrolepiota fuliginosa MF-IS2]|uniref:DUF6533 domain-containing protein n=1 Tax=Macrolepiota fuliginosa MF-IS2 TaxID=1400762 RepID=A0A9P6C5T2_9AGAR|nr:hypothetical protein P691DRAFT_801602 [Macrolepiota fuliginosa MF-IS2]
MSGIAAVNLAAASTVSGGDPQVEQLIATGLQLTHILQVYTSSMMAVSVWDWIACAKMEWTRVWKREWSLVKCLYIWTRYYGMACFAINLWLFNGEFTVEKCKSLHYLIAATCMWVTVGSEAILAIRTYAFLGKKPWVGVLMVAMLLGETAFLLYVAIAGVYQIPPLVGKAGPCTASDKPGKHIVSGFWIAPVIFDLICTGLTVSKAISLRGAGVHSGLVTVFVREGIFYFIAISGVNVLNAAFMIQSADPKLQNLNSFLALILSQVLCCRLVLNLRSRGHEKMGATITDSHPSFGYASRNAQNFSIPLKKYQGTGYRNQDANSDEVYDGVKVQINVETAGEGSQKV